MEDQDAKARTLSKVDKSIMEITRAFTMTATAINEFLKPQNQISLGQGTLQT